MSAKSYSHFTLTDIHALGITVLFGDIFKNIDAILAPSDLLISTLADNTGLPLSTEKAKSEFIVAPILKEIRRRNIDKMTFFSGYNFSVNKKIGLTGRCDFILSLNPNTISIQAPLFCLVEAKNNTPDDENGIAQCIAEMYAAQIFNQQQENSTIKIVYGAVTNGYEWVMMRLEDKNATIELDTRYSVMDLPRLLGILNYITNQY